jgi:thiol:disulfide interchange protein DsbD
VVLGFFGAVRHPAVRWLRGAAGATLALAGAATLFVGEPPVTIAWSQFTDQALVAAREAGRPVLIDFQAVWCIPCREMERTTFRDPEVVSAAREFATLKADVSEEDEQTAALMSRFGVPGVPTYVLLDAQGAERRRFVGYVAAPEFRQALREVATGGARRG